MGISDARKAANARYLAKFERINLTVTAEQKEAIKEAAESVGKSVTSYILYKVFSDTVQDSIGQDTSTASIPVYNTDIQPPTISTKDKPQPPEEIAKLGGNALVMWLVDNGYSDEEISSFLDAH